MLITKFNYILRPTTFILLMARPRHSCLRRHMGSSGPSSTHTAQVVWVIIRSHLNLNIGVYISMRIWIIQIRSMYGWGVGYGITKI
jgi:hypothetical protein